MENPHPSTSSGCSVTLDWRGRGRGLCKTAPFDGLRVLGDLGLAWARTRTVQNPHPSTGSGCSVTLDWRGRGRGLCKTAPFDGLRVVGDLELA
jgi:hypothetical protein